MSDSHQIHPDTISRLTDCEDIATISFDDIVSYFQRETILEKYRPAAVYKTDPRNSLPVLFNSSRAKRPEDYPTSAGNPSAPNGRACPICAGKTTRILDCAPLSRGYTFINKNLYPIAYPHPDKNAGSFGFHFIQWTSSLHQTGWHNMPLNDAVTVIKRLGVLEKHLMDSGDDGYVSIIKNHGPLVGGSLTHDHQQILYSRILPNHFRQDKIFEQSNGAPFTQYIIENNPRKFTLREYTSATLMVPYFSQRPFDMFLALNDTDKKYLHELNRQEYIDVARGWCEAVSLIHYIMPRIGKELAFNVTCHNGPARGIYFEFLPYTQEFGGFERSGLFCCQLTPEEAAEQLRSCLHSSTEAKGNEI